MSPMTLQLHDDGFYVSTGDLVAGKYRVERVLGSGGMAFVLSARHIELDQPFALKFLDEKFLGNERIIERFTQEAKAACKIRSEHVARVYDVGIHDVGGGMTAPFFVMEHLEGRDLSALVIERGALRVDDAVEYVMQACEALAVAHCHGIVHRDIKPENLFLVEREGLPIIKVLDFGISKVALTGGEAPSRLTGELTLGTPCYMSPEQIRSTASADAQSDLWSLGVVLYELLAGTEAFRAESVNAVCAAVLEREPQPLAELRSDLPSGLVDVVMRCLEKDARARYADVAELATALLPFAPTRALVCVERSSSVMRGARRAANANANANANAREARISSVRPSAMANASRHPSSGRSAPAARHPSLDVEPPLSAAPLSAAPVTLEPRHALELLDDDDMSPDADVALMARQREHPRSALAFASAALGAMALIGLVAYGATAGDRAATHAAGQSALVSPPPEAEPAPKEAAIRTAVAERLPTVASVDPDPSATALKRAASAVPPATATATATTTTARAAAGPRASSTQPIGSAVEGAGSKRPGGAAASATASASVELGY